MTLNVHILNTPEPSILLSLKAQLDSGITVTTGSELPSPAHFHILVGGCPDRAHLTASQNLHTLIIPYAGLPEDTRDLMAEFPEITVANLHHNAVPTAEMALALLLTAAKFLIPFDRQFRRSDWRPRYQPNPSLLLKGKTVLLLGYGHIGQRVGRVCQALGLRVLAVRRQPAPERMSGTSVAVHPLRDLHALLERTQVLILTLPATPETKGMIGEQELALMPSGGILVNVGRGPVVDQGALYAALKTRHLCAAGLDVWYNYPAKTEERESTPPADLPFHELDNVVMSPHRGGGSDQTEVLRMTHLADCLNAAARGEQIPNRVDLAAGY